MGQQKALIYAFVGRGNVILAEYTDFSGNFNSIAYQCLQKLPASNNKFTYNCDGHTFNYLVDNGFTYCVVAEESVGRQVPIAFLERVKDDFVSKYGGGKAATAPPNSLNKEYGPKLKEHMQYCAEHPEEISKLAKVKAQVSEVKGVMMENIEKGFGPVVRAQRLIWVRRTLRVKTLLRVLDRGEKIELLVDKTENLHHQQKFVLSVQAPMRVASVIVTGTGLQEHGNTNTEENVAAKHEDQADSVRYPDSFDPHHCSLSVQGIQLWKVNLLSFCCDATVVRKALSYISIYISVRIETVYVLSFCAVNDLFLFRGKRPAMLEILIYEIQFSSSWFLFGI
ncbi:Vesicle-associated membrane protein [Capsicum annuum]|nr:Vesicle-associated membrane protein [Capsicum annuum]